MKIIKAIEFDGYTTAHLVHMYEDGAIVAEVFQIETAEDGTETIIKQDHDIVFPAGYFELTEAEENELKGITEETEVTNVG